MRADLAHALAAGEATLANNGRLFFTARGRKVWHAEYLESFDFD
jgi:hypothetical protein